MSASLSSSLSSTPSLTAYDETNPFTTEWLLQSTFNANDTRRQSNAIFHTISSVNSSLNQSTLLSTTYELNTNTQNNSEIGDYAEKLYRLLLEYYVPTLAITGTIGNILSVLVFFKTNLRKLSSSYYLAALGVNDTCFLIILFTHWLNHFDITVTTAQDINCQLFIYLTQVFSFCSVWYVVAFTVERFIAVLYPLKRQTMCTVRRAKIVLAALTIVGAIYCAPVLVFAQSALSHNNTTICVTKGEFKDQTEIYSYIDLIFVFVVPFTSIAILNTFTAVTVWKVAGIRRSVTIQKRKTRGHDTRKQLSATPYQCTTHPNGQHSIKSASKTTASGSIKNSQLKVTKMLLIVSTVFICLNLPDHIMRLCAFVQTTQSKIFNALQYCAWFLFTTNFGINFVLYCISGQNFRKAVISMFTNGSSAQRQADCGTQATVSECIRTTGSNTSRRRIFNRNETWSDMHELHTMNSSIK